MDEKVVFRKPTKKEINDIIKRSKKQMKKEHINITNLATELNVNYGNLVRVLNGKLINYQIINKLNEWAD